MMTTGALTADVQTAASHMVRNIPRAFADTPVGSVVDSLRGARFECADTVFVTDHEGRLEGIVRINDLLANGERKISDIMMPEHQSVRLSDDQEQIAVLAMQLDMIAVPVVDDEERLIGAVPPEALFRILRAEHMEDLQRLAGIAPHERGPEFALGAPLHDRFRRRLPWLIFGLFASFIMTSVMVSFETTFRPMLWSPSSSQPSSISLAPLAPRPFRWLFGASQPAASRCTCSCVTRSSLASR
jgi:magnesium transporter